MQDSEILEILRSVKSIALVGASNKPERPSYRVMHYLLAQGYHVIPVNPQMVGQNLLGQKVVATLKEIGESVDMVDVFRQSEAAYDIAQEAVDIHASVLWLQLGVINPAAVSLAKNAGLKVVMDRCPKIEIPRLGLER